MGVFDRYLLKQILIACVFVIAGLAGVVVLVQSLRFIDLIVNSGASAGVFWTMIGLALPRFLEVMLPLEITIAVVFVYARMIVDRELIAMRASGANNFQLAIPAIVVSLIACGVLWTLSLWVTPMSFASMQNMQSSLKTQMPALLFREGIFATPTDGLTVYMRERKDGSMRGLMLYDARGKSEIAGKKSNPYIVLAKEGSIETSKDGYKIIVRNGARHEFDREDKTLHRLDFQRYNIDLPNKGSDKKRWLHASERSLFQLINPKKDDLRAQESKSLFTIELNRRLAQPILVITFSVVSLCILMGGQFSRDGPGYRAAAAILSAVFIQGAFLIVLNAANGVNSSPAMSIVFWLLALVPIVAALVCMFGSFEKGSK